MTLSFSPIDERFDVTREVLRAQVVPAYRPVVLRGFAADWPAVAAGRLGAKASADYLKGLDNGAPVEAFVGAPEIKGRFFYGDAERTVNFERRQGGLSAALDQILALEGQGDPPSIYVGSTPTSRVAPGFAAANRNAVLDAPVEPRLWVGTAVTVQTHYDMADNIAVVVAGRRRFTLFPPEQTTNLYVGPLDFTLAGQPVSMVSLDAPDYARHPRFAEAEKHGLSAELGPGDAIYIPTLWWHHVRSLESLNVLVNYWWRDLPPEAGSPFEVLVHGLLAVRHLPPPQREAWRAIFDHYLFETNGDPAAHLPPDRKGVLGPLTPRLARNVRAFLKHALG
ncbi:MAG: transcription factor jumonji jmjC domain protein [Caulobacter sp.]|nr:transcription factor jumonji jmjC domain protein [Caulobacter sp.]